MSRRARRLTGGRRAGNRGGAGQWPGEHLPRRRHRAAYPEAGRGRPDRHPADPRHGRVRAVAKGVRRTKSRFGARLEPFTHVDLQLYTGRSLDVITQAETLRPLRRAAGRGLSRGTPRAPRCWRPPSGSPRSRRSRRCGSSCCSSAGCGRWARASMSRGWYSTLFCCAHSRSRDTRRAGRMRDLRDAGAVAGSRRIRARRRPSPCGAGQSPADVRRRAPAGCLPVLPGARRGHPSAPTIALMSALLRGDWAHADASERRHQVECSGLVAAYLQWHLEHSIRSLRARGARVSWARTNRPHGGLPGPA